MDTVAILIDQFEHSLSFFETNLIYDFDSHIKAIRHRYQFEHVLHAIKDDEFLASVRATLSDWKLRRAGLLQADEFMRLVRQHAQPIQNLETFELGISDPTASWEQVWNIIAALPITRKQPRLVSGTKLFHHLLPNLIVPVDRYYTRVFLFAYGNNDYQDGEGERATFRVAFHCFSRIAAAIRPSVGGYQRRHPAHTSISKIIDNAIMGFVELTRQQMWNI